MAQVLKTVASKGIDDGFTEVNELNQDNNALGLSFNPQIYELERVGDDFLMIIYHMPKSYTSDKRVCEKYQGELRYKSQTVSTRMRNAWLKGHSYCAPTGLSLLNAQKEKRNSKHFANLAPPINLRLTEFCYWVGHALSLTEIMLIDWEAAFAWFHAGRCLTANLKYICRLLPPPQDTTGAGGWHEEDLKLALTILGFPKDSWDTKNKMDTSRVAEKLGPRLRNKSNILHTAEHHVEVHELFKHKLASSSARNNKEFAHCWCGAEALASFESAGGIGSPSDLTVLQETRTLWFPILGNALAVAFRKGISVNPHNMYLKLFESHSEIWGSGKAPFTKPSLEQWNNLISWAQDIAKNYCKINSNTRGRHVGVTAVPPMVSTENLESESATSRRHQEDDEMRNLEGQIPASLEIGDLALDVIQSKFQVRSLNQEVVWQPRIENHTALSETDQGDIHEFGQLVQHIWQSIRPFQQEQETSHEEGANGSPPADDPVDRGVNNQLTRKKKNQNPTPQSERNTRSKKIIAGTVIRPRRLVACKKVK